MLNLNLVFILMVIMQFKHFIADYPLQTPYMLGKFRDKGWVLPLAAHCFIHFLITTLIALYSGVGLFSLALGVLDFSIHFVMDRIKASPNMLGKFQALSKKEMIDLIHKESIIRAIETLDPIMSHSLDKIDIAEKKKSNVLFWWSLGLDQMVHHLTDILVVYLIVSNL